MCSVGSVTAGKLSGVVFPHRPPTVPPKQSQKCSELPLPFPFSSSNLQLPTALQEGRILFCFILNLSYGCRAFGTLRSRFPVFPWHRESQQCVLQKAESQSITWVQELRLELQQQTSLIPPWVSATRSGAHVPSTFLSLPLACP